MLSSKLFNKLLSEAYDIDSNYTVVKGLVVILSFISFVSLVIGLGFIVTEGSLTERGARLTAYLVFLIILPVILELIRRIFNDN